MAIGIRKVGDDSSIVNWQSQTGQMPSGGCLAFGKLWLGQGSSVVSFDKLSGAPGPRYSGFGSGGDPRFVQPYGDLLAVACDDKQLYTVAPDSGVIAPLAYVGNLTWMAAYEGSVFIAGDRGVLRVARPEENVHTPYGPLVGPYGQGNLGGAPAVADGVLYVPLSDTSVDALDAMTLSKLWSAGADARPGPVFCDGSRLCFVTAKRSLYVYAVATHERVALFSLVADVEGQPLLDGNLSYAALVSGLVEVLDVKTGKPVKSFQLPAPPNGTPILNENGVLFYGSAAAIFAIDTTAGSTTGVESYRTDAAPFLAAYEDGALFYADKSQAAAVRLDEHIHEYYAESNLIRDFDFSGSIDSPASTPNFQVEIGLFTNEGAPRSEQTVRITATEPTTLVYQGQRTPISPTQFLDVVTDGAGRFRLGVPAGTLDDQGQFREGLTAPELLLASPFMDPNMRFVVRPHGQLQDHLTSISKDQLQNAKGYDASFIVIDQYRNDDAAMSSATSAINQTASMVRASMSAPRKRSAGNLYCDPACDMAVACCMPANAPTGKVVCKQSYSFDLTLGSSRFALLAKEDARAAFEALGSQRLTGWLGDFWDDIKTGAAKVVGAVVEAVADGAQAMITAIKDGACQVFHIVIDTIEKAVLLVQGIFNTIASAIKRVIEAVSFLFDWTAILDLHDQIREQVMGAWASLSTGANGVSYDAIKAALDGWFQTATDKADQAFGDAKSALGVRTPLGAQSEATGRPNAVVGSGQDNWLLAKFQDNAIPPAPSGSATGMTTAAVSWPAFNPGSEVAQAFDNLLSELGEALSDNVRATIARVREDLDFQASPGVLARSFAAVIDIIRGLTDVAINIAKAIGDLLIDLFKAIMSAVQGFVTATIEIPYVSDFYRWATGRDLSLLDLFALLTAIPTGFALRLVSRDPAYASGVSPLRPKEPAARALAKSTVLPVGWVEVAAGVTQAVWGVVSGVVSALDLRQSLTYGPPLPGSGLSAISKVRLAVTAVATFLVRGIFLAATLIKGLGLNIVTWLVPTLVMVTDCILIWAKNDNPDTNPITATIAALLGLIMLILAVVQIFNGDGIGNWLGVGFVTAVGISLFCRLAVAVKDPKVKYAGIAASSAFLVISGGLEIARGVVEA